MLPPSSRATDAARFEIGTFKREGDPEPLKEHVIELADRAVVLRLAQVDRRDPRRKGERQRDVGKTGIDEPVVAGAVHLSGLA